MPNGSRELRELTGEVSAFQIRREFLGAYRTWIKLKGVGFATIADDILIKQKDAPRIDVLYPRGNGH